jgi:uncharacterized protein YdeI (YjbR/CyaY-like superfamily)
MVPSKPTPPVFFASPVEFRRWLARHHESAPELWVGFHKKSTGRPSLTWTESVDEALSFGWIDGVRKSLGPERYVIRFTPRKRGSVWSKVNVARAERLIREGRMQAAGWRAFAGRDASKTGIYSFEQRESAKLRSVELRQFRGNAPAWSFFQSQPPSYRTTAIWWIVSAKRPATRARRLATLIDDSAAGRRIAPLRRAGPRSELPNRSMRGDR